MASADRLIEVFNEAKARPIGAERDQFLSEACRDEPELKEQVLSLLLAHEGAGDFLKYTQAIPPVTLLTEKPGDKIGRYKLLQKIGEGGCGVVYMAEQEEPVRRRVAFKVIKLGMDTKQVVARFEAEGQALAMMDHPNIAKVFDAGATNTGRPYFVMELVRGIKITEYCDQNNLPTEARLKLFTQVCHAIQHAHQKGIIHRDIKPSNILVTINDGLPVPKVIDFGIAKAIEQRLTDKTVFTAFEQFIGTPAYMSPEQAEMTSLDIDTRADIYSLGVLLYELLSGNTPFDAEKLVAAGVAEIRRIIREQEPPKPSTRLNTLCDADQGTVASRRHTDPPKLIHLLRGDLDWIVMKCLEKDRTRRYETANGLALDLQRHLDNEPIIARPPSTVYRFQKLVRRNKLAFAASATVLLVLLGGIAVSTWQAIRATRAEREQTRLREQAENARNNEARERAKAEANEKKAASEAAKSQQVSTFLKDTLKGVGPSVALGRDTRMLREILNQTARNLSGLKGQPAVEADLRETLGVVYRDLGDYTDAEAMLVQALELRKELHPNNDPEVARSLHELAEVFRLQTRNSEAEKYFRQALTMRRKLFDNDNVDVAATMFGLAEVIRRDSATRAEEAVQLHLEALAMRRKVLGNQHLDVARSLTGLAILIKKAPENLPQAEACLNEALSIQRGQLGDEHPDVAYTLSNLGILLKSVSGKRAEAERMLREAVAMQKKLLGDHRETALSIYFLAQTVQNPTEAEQLYREALTMRRKVLGVKHADTASSLRSLINHLNSAGKLAEIESLYREVLAEQRSGPGNGSSAMVETLSNLAENLQLQSKPVEAEKASREALDILSKLPGSEFAKFPTAVRRLAAALNAQGKPGEAEKLYEESITAVPQKPGKSNPALGQMLHNYANFLLYQRNNPAAAVEQYLKALAIRREKTDGALVVTLRELGHALLTSANAKDAEPYLRESRALYRKLYSKDDIWGTANANLLLAQALQQLHRLPEAEQSYTEALAAYANSEGIGGDGYNTTVRSLVQLLNSEDQPAKAEALCRKILAQQRAALTNDNPAVALTLIILAHGLEAQGKVTEAEATIRESLAMASHARADATNAGLFNSLAWRLVTAENPTSSDATVAVELAQKAVVATNRKNVGILDTLAVAHSLAGQFTNAVAVQHEAIALLQDKKQIENYTVRLKLYESNSPYRNQAALARRVSALLAQGKFAEAESPARECLAQREKQSPDDWLTFNAMSMLGGSLLGQKKFPAAEPLLLSGYEGMKQRADIIPANGKVRLQECIQRLVQLYKATDQSEKAAEWNKKLAEFSQP